MNEHFWLGNITGQVKTYPPITVESIRELAFDQIKAISIAKTRREFK